ncbi:hypothetical protein SAMN06265795_10770 [Noviherbaspirillum humi]|uniref:PilX N-terminal n=2 Tax=Noviherbaspirillum humi TaxID=1688639 RepID=A0A239HN58_9BURK|nr:hypothetical protein SAMN06265795_10770 [Noviherbaspirillum humi]
MNTPITRKFQRGAVSLAVTLLILFLLTAVVQAGLSLSSGVNRNAVDTDDRAQALLIAESAAERAAARFAGGAACDAGTTSSSIGETSVSMLGSGMASISYVSYTSGVCVVSITGSTTSGSGSLVRGASRSIQASVVSTANSVNASQFVSPTATSGPISGLTHTVAAGTTMVLVNLAWKSGTSCNQTWSVSTLSFTGSDGNTYSAVPASLLYSSPSSNCNGNLNRIWAQTFYIMNPPSGGSLNNGVLNLSIGSGSTFGNKFYLLVGYIDVSDVLMSGSTPVLTGFGIGGSDTGNPIAPSVTTNSTRYSLVVDNIGLASNGNLASFDASVCTGRTAAWNGKGNMVGQGTYCPSVAPGTTVTMRWPSQGSDYAISGVAVPASSAGLPSGGRVRTKGGGVQGWREIVQ